MVLAGPYQGGALPLSYRSAGAVYARESRDNQWVFDHSSEAPKMVIRAMPRRTKREKAGLIGTILTHCRSQAFPMVATPSGSSHFSEIAYLFELGHGGILPSFPHNFRR